MAAVPRTSPGRTRERALFSSRGLVAGIDEVGRGAWAGPVVASAVILPEECDLAGVYDSKIMTAAERAEAASSIHRVATAITIGEASVGEINRNGLSWAIRMAGWRTLRQLPEKPENVLLDGQWNYLPRSYSCETIVDGDAKELCIAAASVVAKTHRDALMTALERSGNYGFARHKGYGTRGHQSALSKHGVSRWHRRSYRPISSLLQPSI